MANRNSEVYLVSGIKLDRNYVNVLSYSESQMLELCKQNAVAHRSNFSFLRPQNSIFADFSYEEALQSNYIAFQNPDYSNKWFFAFIDQVIYKGEKNVEITYKIDSWSTWFDYWQKQPCFISRQHVNDDSIGLHTIPENLDIGEIRSIQEVTDLSLSDLYWVAVLSNYNPKTEDDNGFITVHQKQVYGSDIYLFRSSDLINLGLFIYKTAVDKGSTDTIQNIFIIPDFLIDPSNIEYFEDAEVGGQTFSFYKLPRNDSESPENFNLNINKIINYSDYQPKNNKCFVYPFNYIYATNNSGNENIYKFEDFTNGNGTFLVEGVITQGGSVRLVPLNYKGIEKNVAESIPLGKYPNCSWTSDAFTNWLTQNAVNVPLSITNNLLSSAGQMVSGDVVSGATSVANTIGNTIGAFYSASLLPNVAQGGNNGDINFSAGTNTFMLYQMRPKTEYLQIIDDFFTRFGYKINKIESPNIVGRSSWNYVEIGQNECIGYGSVPTVFMKEINQACRTGVTIWHNHSSIGNYNLDNSIS